MIHHEDATGLLARRRELTQAEERRLDAHLALCAACRDTAAAFADQDELLLPLAGTRPGVSVRAATLSAARAPRRSWRRWTAVSVAALAASIVCSLGGYVAAAGSLPWDKPDRHLGQGYTGPNGGRFAPITPGPDMIPRTEAIALALSHSEAQTDGRLLPHVSVDAYLGRYTDTLFRPRPVWIVYFHGSGLEIAPDGGITSPVQTLDCPPRVAHEETVIIDARSGAFVEEAVGLIPGGFPNAPTPVPPPTLCPAPPPTMIAPSTIATASNGTILLAGSRTAFTYQFQIRTPAGRLVRHWPLGGRQVNQIATDARGDVYVVSVDAVVRKFSPSGHLLWQRALPPDNEGAWSIAVAADGTAYVAEPARSVIQVLDPDGTVRAVWHRHTFQLAVEGTRLLTASRAGRLMILSRQDKVLIRRRIFGAGEGSVIALAGRGNALYVLEQRQSPTRFLGYFVAHLSAGGRLLGQWRVPTVTGTVTRNGSDPSGITVDRQGRVLVADKGRARVLVFTDGGRFVDAWST